MSKIKWLFCLLFIVIGTLSSAQDSDPIPTPKNLSSSARQREGRAAQSPFMLGGYLGLQFGSATCIELSPHVTYKPIPYFAAGAGVTYMYAHVNNRYSGYEWQSHVVGANVYLEGFVFRERLLAHVEYEFLSFFPTDRPQSMSHAILLGPGFNMPVSPRVSVYGLILFPVYTYATDNAQVYSIPILRLGINTKL